MNMFNLQQQQGNQEHQPKLKIAQIIELLCKISRNPTTKEFNFWSNQQETPKRLKFDQTPDQDSFKKWWDLQGMEENYWPINGIHVSLGGKLKEC